MSIDINKSCSFLILISLTTVVRQGHCHLKSEVAVNWCWCCHVVFSPSTDLPIIKSVVLQHHSTVIWKWLQYQFWPQSYIQLL